MPFYDLDKDLKIIFLSNLLAALGDGFVVYLLPLYLTGELKALPENVGLLYSLSTLAAALTMIPGGFLADRYDRKKILLFSWVLWIPIPLTFFFATDWNQLILPMFIYGITLSGSASSAYILGHSKSGKMASAFTTLGAAFALGYVVSSLTAGALSSFLDMRFIFLVTVVFYSLAGLVLFLIKGQNPRRINLEDPVKLSEKSSPAGSSLKKLVLICLLFAVMMFASSTIAAPVSLFQRDMYGFSVSAIVLLGAVNYFGGFILSFAVGKIGDKFGNYVSVAFSMLIMGLALSLFIFSGNFGVQTFAAFLRGASFPMWMYMGVMAGGIAPPTKKAQYISIVQFATRLATVPAALVGGLLYEQSFQMPFLFAISIVFSLTIVLCFKSYTMRVATNVEEKLPSNE